MSAANNPARIVICRAMVGLPAVAAPKSDDPARIVCHMCDSLAHHSRKRNQAYNEPCFTSTAPKKKERVGRDQRIPY
jgi:hypothetical protein